MENSVIQSKSSLQSPQFVALYVLIGIYLISVGLALYRSWVLVDYDEKRFSAISLIMLT